MERMWNVKEVGYVVEERVTGTDSWEANSMPFTSFYDALGFVNKQTLIKDPEDIRIVKVFKTNAESID